MDTPSGNTCVRCLVIVNGSMEHRVSNQSIIPSVGWMGLASRVPGVYPYLSVQADPRETVAWHETIMEESGGEARFTLGPMYDTLTGFAVVGGTLLCVGHMWQALDPNLIRPVQASRPRDRRFL